MKKKTELSLTLSTFLSEMKIINNLALGSQRAVHWHRLHEQRQRKLKCTFHYYNNLHDQTLSSEHAIGHHDIWKKIFGYQQGSHQSNVVGGGNSPVGLVSG